MPEPLKPREMKPKRRPAPTSDDLLGEGFILPGDVPAPAPLYVGPLTHILRDPDTRTPRERRDAADADLAAWNAQHAAERTPSMRRAVELGRRIRDSAEPETGIDYSPGVLAMRFLDVPTFGLADEGMAGIASLLDPELRYADAQRMIEEGVATGAREHPGSALLGTGAGLLGGGALLDAPAFLGATGRGATAAAAARGAAVPAAIGALGGGASGYARAPEGHRLASTLEGAATGAIEAGAGGALAGLARGARTPGVRETLRRLLGTAAAEGAGFGLMATPGASSHTVLEPDALAREGLMNAAAGAGVGAGAAGVGRALSAPSRAVADMQEVLAERGARTRPGASVDFAPVDEAAIDTHAIGSEADDAPLLDLGDDAATIATRSMSERESEPLVRRLTREAVETDPVMARFRAAGLMDRRQVRALVRSFGGQDRALAALQEAGLARPGVYSQASQVQAAERVAPAMRRDLAAIHRRVAADERPIAGSRIADRIDTALPDYEGPAAGPADLRVSSALRGRADDFRYGSGVRPATIEEPLRFEGTANDALVAPVTELPPDLQLTYPELRTQLERQGQRNRVAYSGAPGELSPDQEAGVDTYRAMQGVRDEEIRTSLGEAGYQDYLRRNAASRAAGAVVDGNVFNLRNPSGMLGQIGGMIGGAGPGRVIGEAQQRLIGQYRDSILATLNEIGSHSSDVLATAPRIVRVLEWASTPGAPVRIGGVTVARDARSVAQAIEGAARAGAGPATIAALKAQADAERLPGIEARAAGTGDESAQMQQAIDAYAAERNAALRDRLTPRAAAATVEPSDPATADVDTGYIEQRNNALIERIRRRAATPTR